MNTSVSVSCVVFVRSHVTFQPVVLEVDGAGAAGQNATGPRQVQADNLNAASGQREAEQQHSAVPHRADAGVVVHAAGHVLEHIRQQRLGAPLGAVLAQVGPHRLDESRAVDGVAVDFVDGGDGAEVGVAGGRRELPVTEVAEVGEQLLAVGGHRGQTLPVAPLGVDAPPRAELNLRPADREPAISSGSPAGPYLAKAFAAFSGVYRRL